MIRLDIENRILLPLLVLIIVPIISIGALSYKNAYEMSLEREWHHMDQLLQLIEADRQGVQIEGYRYDFVPETSFEGAGGETGRYLTEETLVSYRYVPEDRGYATLAYEREKLANSLFDFQKNSILVAIVSMLVSTQIIIILANYISNPLRRMRKTCETIQNGGYEKMTMTHRKDELGILAKAFNNMMETIAESTEAIASLQALNQKILENAPIALFLVDNKGPAALNKRAEKWIAMELVEKGSGERLERFLQYVTDNAVYRLKDTATGKNYHLDLSKTELQDVGAIISLHDITRRRMLENQVEQMDKLSSLGRLSAGLAHEIRNPLTGIRGGIQILSKRHNHDDASEAIYEMLLSEIDRLNHLINEMLNYAKPSVANHRICSIEEQLMSTLQLMKDYFKDKGVQWSVSSDLETGACLLDPNQLKQILLNLFENAVQAMEKTEKRLQLTLYHTNDGAGQRWIGLRIQDNGRGIARADIKHLFDPFFTRFEGGTGLGLAIVQKLMTENNGQIEFESTEGIGTTVTLLFEEADHA
jgi:signal transduction histidine kinase